MSISYRAVQWNRQKRMYDLTLAVGCVLYLAVFLGASIALRPGTTAETALIRGFGTLSFLLLHVILSIGPLCRLDHRFLPLLYNRRHLGVTMFLAALAHGLLSLIQFHALGVLDPLASVLVSNGSYGVAESGLAQFPFQPLGFVALLVLFVMAATSHDFWLANLTAPTWKRLHMGVYFAYALLIAHVALGALQQERATAYSALLGLGLVWVAGLHLAAGWKESAGDAGSETKGEDGWVEVGHVDDIAEDRAVTVCLAGERVAIFRYDGKISALSNVCQHQNGPLGEGKIVDGCIVCPWHGYQYRPEDGSSPPPFTEKVPTFRVAVREGEILVDPTPLPPGTRTEPARIPAEQETPS
ncbi:MAG: ferric reductase-like transmembrane domain-containing protein [Thermoanaerobaculia bacterium]|nr:ferric reductase-like transmembrane domain-containing protein [Thermoanaerobaculia bacterium]